MRLRPRLSLRTEMILLLGAIVLLATASLGSIAFQTSRKIVEDNSVRAVGMAADAQKQALIRFLSSQMVRVGAVVETVSLGCTPDETPCIRTVLTNFRNSESATAVQIRYRNRRPITVSDEGIAFQESDNPTGIETARFASDEHGLYYIIQVQRATRDGNMTGTLRGNMSGINSILGEHYGLGNSSDSFLLNSQGRFLTPSRYASPGDEPASSSGTDVIRECLNGKDGNVLGAGYHGIPVIHAFRYVPEIGGGCIVAQIDQSEAFAPTRSLRTELIRISILLGIIAILCSLIFAQVVSRPINRLRDRASSLQAGDFDSPVPVKGFAEAQMFAETFAAMATSLKQSRTQLERSNAQITSILESITDGFLAIDHNWRCLYVNHVAATITRTPRERLIGSNVFYWVEKNLSATARTQLERAMAERTHAHFEEYYEPFDSWFEVDAHPNADGLAVFGRDVTERKRVNERLQRTQRLESLGVLAGGIAHDFNNLLTGIIGNASLALEEQPPKPMRSWLESVITAGEQAAGLTRQLLAYAGKGRFVIQPIDLSDLVRETSQLVQASIPQNVQLHLQLDENIPAVEGDVAQLQQVIMNLVINAAEAIGDGRPGSVTVITSMQPVDETYIQQTVTAEEISPGLYISLEVTDNGSGMDEATIGRIFEPFFTTKFAGRGLGLAAVIGIVRRHKGTLKVYSIPGQGSSFKMLIPAADRAAELPAAHDVEPRGGSETILVIDDEEIVRQAARAALQRVGYTVILAENGDQGLRRFRERSAKVSLILTDLTMPGMSCEELLEGITALRPDVPIILSSGFHENDATRGLTAERLSGFLQKPYTARELAACVRNTLDEFQLRQRHIE